MSYTRTALDKVANHYLETHNLPKLKQEVLQQALLSIVCITGVPLYFVPADAYAKDHYGEESLGLRASFVVGTCLPALAVLWNATGIFLKIRGSQNVPSELKDVLINPFTFKQRLANDIGITIVSALSALPLATICFAYPIPNAPTAVTYLLAIFAEVDNTVLHFLPIQLALSQRIYRLPVVPFELAYGFFKKRTESKEVSRLKNIEQQKNAIYAGLKGSLLGMLTAARNNVSINAVVFNSKKMSFEYAMQDDLKELAGHPDDFSGSAKLATLAKHKLPSSYTPSSWYNSVLRETAYWGGAAWVVSSCAGYLSNTVEAMISLTGDEVAGALTATPPDYFLGVLFVFYGGYSLQNIYDYMTNWGADQPKIPLEFKLYPKSTMLLMVFALYVAAFSYGAANKLVEDTFQGAEWKEVIEPVLVWLSRTGVPFISAIAMRDFYITAMNKYAMYFGGDDAKMAICLYNMIEALMIGINLMPGNTLVESLQQMDDATLHALLGIGKIELDAKCKELIDLEKQKTLPVPDKSNDSDSQAAKQDSIFRRSISGAGRLFSSQTRHIDHAIEASISRTRSQNYRSTDNETDPMVVIHSQSTPKPF